MKKISTTPWPPFLRGNLEREPFFKGEFGELEKWSAGVLGCLAQIFRF